MIEASLSLLSAWQNFYVIIGSAAAALTGLMFVVVTLIVGMQRNRSDASVNAFGTPTVVHFSAAILVAAIISAPWYALWHVSVVLSIAGFIGVLYMLIVIRRTLHVTDYQPVLEDWLCHAIFPFIAYTAIFVSALFLASDPEPALFVIGAMVIVLVCIGIHNAWDTITFIAYTADTSSNSDQVERNDG